MGKKGTQVQESLALFFSTTYSGEFNITTNIIYNYLPIRNQDPILKEILKDCCKCVAKRGGILSNILSPSFFPK